MYVQGSPKNGIYLRKTVQEVNNTDADNPEARRYFQTECRKSAEDIVRFISSLQRESFKEFWLPCKSPFSLPREIGGLTPYRQRIPPNLNGNPPRPLRPRNNRRRSCPLLPRQRRNLPYNPPPRSRRRRLGRSRHVP